MHQIIILYSSALSILYSNYLVFSYSRVLATLFM